MSISLFAKCVQLWSLPCMIAKGNFVGDIIIMTIGIGDMTCLAFYISNVVTHNFRYFISYVMQFHFHKTLCDAKGYSGPLHLCDIYGSETVGLKFR